MTPLAFHLLDLGMPFVVHTATGLPSDLAAAPAALAMVMKPTLATRVVTTLMCRFDPSEG